MEIPNRPYLQGRYALFAALHLSDGIAQNNPGCPCSSVLTCRTGSG